MGGTAKAGRVLAGAAGAVLGGALGTVARLRDDRALHPRGVLVHGRLERHGVRSGAAWVDGPGDEQVLVRLSRGGGLPAWLPDVHGLALRHATGDLLLSATGTAPVLRHVLAPRRRPARATYGSLLPFRGPHGPLLLAAVPLDHHRWPRDLDALPAALRVQPMVLALAWAGPLGAWQVFGRLTLTAADGDVAEDVRLDPAHLPAGLSTYPWVTRVRTPAYLASRRHGSRDAADPSTHPDTDERDRSLAADRREP